MDQQRPLMIIDKGPNGRQGRAFALNTKYPMPAMQNDTQPPTRSHKTMPHGHQP